MKKKILMGSTVLGLTVILLTLSGSLLQASIVTEQYNSLTATPAIIAEELTVTAGLGSAALVQINIIGGPDQDIDTGTLLANVVNWVYVVSFQDGFDTYLLRRPFLAPENATLVLEIKATLGADGSLTEALSIAEDFSTFYGITLHWARAMLSASGNYVYAFTGGASETNIEDLVTEIRSAFTTGFAKLIDPTVVSSAPIKAVYIGEGAFEGYTFPMRGVTYVDDAAITGTDPYTLSTNNLFGVNVAPCSDSGYLKFSEVKIRFPYTVNPSSISPIPDNFAPQITGKMDWMIQRGDFVKSLTNYEIIFDIDHTTIASNPRVQVNMGYNQTLLQKEGKLEMLYEVTNTGEETAENILISYPLGPAFQDLLDKKPDIYRLRDDVEVDESVYMDIYGTFEVTYSGSGFGGFDDIYEDQIVLVLDGWYRNENDDLLVDIDDTNKNELLKEESVVFYYMGSPIGTVEISVSIHCIDGLSNILIERVRDALALVNLEEYTSILDVQGVIDEYRDTLEDSVALAARQLFDLLYQAQSVFDFVKDGDFSIVEKTVGHFELERTEYFLEARIDRLLQDEIVYLNWTLENIPSQAWRVGLMRIVYPFEVGGTIPAVKLDTVGYDFEEIMQIALGFADAAGQLAHGRLISFYDPWNDVWISPGARYRYEDSQNFEYFGFSNGLNFQIADEEAVLKVNVAMDSTTHYVGDPVRIDYSIENMGNLAAHEVKLRLFHGQMGNDWQITYPEEFAVDDIGTIPAGETYSDFIIVDANSFLGIHSVYGVADFISDYGELPLDVEDWFGNTEQFEGAAETHHLVLSNMDWVLLLPITENMEPAFPQPVLDIEVVPNFISNPDVHPYLPTELEIVITITNVGEETTSITAYQYYNLDELEYVFEDSTLGSASVIPDHYGMGLIIFDDITLAPEESVTLTMRWKFVTNDGCYLPGLQIIYDSRFENELGGGGVAIEVSNGEQLLITMDATSQDTNDWEDYGASTATGTSAGADVQTSESHTRAGSLDLVFWALGAVFVTAIVARIKRKK